MKIIETTNKSATLRFSRDDFQDVYRTLCIAAYMLTAAREKALKLTDKELEIGTAFLPKIQQLLDEFTKIAIENGWIADDE
jgi:hypothetical protein